MNLPIYKIEVSEKDESGVDFISLVEYPAMEVEWVTFSKDKPMFFADVEQRKLIGAFIIPDKPIYRNDEGREYEVVFTKEVTAKIAEKFNKSQKNININLEHTTQTVQAFVSENWIVEDENDKSKKYGLNFPIGTWAGVVKVEDENFWNSEVKQGRVRGFSVEGLMKLVKLNTNKMKVKVKLAQVSTQEGVEIVYDNLEVGASVSVVTAEGEVTAPDGSYTIEDGTIIVVAGGVISEVTAPQVEEEMQEEAPAVNVAEIDAKIAELSQRIAALEEALSKSTEETQTLSAQVELMKNELPSKSEVVKLEKQEVKKVNLFEVVRAAREVSNKK